MIATISTQPVVEPIALNEAKLHLRIDANAEDEYVTSLIQAARQWCEGYEGQAYMMRTIKVYLDSFAEISLPFFPLVSVSSIQYVDSDGNTQTLSSSYYTVDTDSTPGRVYLAYNQTWPTIRDVKKAVTITCNVGYATTFTVNTTTDILTVSNAFFADEDVVRVRSSIEDNAALPTGLSANTDYYVRDVSGSTLKLAATSGGAAIDLTGSGTGTFYIGFAGRGLVPERVIWAIELILTHLHEHRGDDDITMPKSARNLLLERVWT